ncbi:MAG TPA: FtsX-like permease family protein [Steroidobacteraceae bacterium]|jgi:putative ABC transport system permease protein
MNGSAFRVLTLSQLREQPLRAAASLAAIALGVALGVAVNLINASALAEFEQATRQVIGRPDLVIQGPAAGFEESLFVRLAHDAAVALASPVLEMNVGVSGPARPALKVLALDPFRAAQLQPELLAALSRDVTALFEHDALALSSSAAAQYGVARGGQLVVDAGAGPKSLRIIDVLPESAYPGELGIMDIGAAQWTLGRLGQLTRIDLRLRAGGDAGRTLARLARLMPAGVFVVGAQAERGRVATATRAYRVNLGVLALVALLTGAFVVFSAQWLSILRRRSALGLLRALGVTRAELRRALLLESLAGGLAGSLLGVVLGALIAAALLHRLGANLGNGQLAALGASLRLQALPLLGYIALGTGAAVAGGALPAWQAARRAPALSLKPGDAEDYRGHLHTTLPGVGLVLAGTALAWLPPVGGLPLAGYLSIGSLLLGAVLLVPPITQRAMALLPHTGLAVTDTAFAQLRGSLASSSVSLASIIVSFSLMVAMAIMVHSFRDSFDRWLLRLLPADLQLRGALRSDVAGLSPDLQARLAALNGVTRIEFRRTQSLYLGAEHAPVTLIARDIDTAHAAETLPLLARQPNGAVAPGLSPAWISEALQDLYGYRPGQLLQLPLAGRQQRFYVAGVWRDYVRAGGAIVIARSAYVAATGDHTATEASIWRNAYTDVGTLSAAIRATLGDVAGYELLSSPELRDRSLAAFDRAFVVTYALEAVAVLLGLLGVSVAASATALARRAQFGMLRHVGMLRRQVQWMFAGEGLALSSIAVLYGLLLGGMLSLVLVYVVNRQSFHWSIDLAIPWLQLAALSLSLIAASALTALWSGRAALSGDPIRAVREDW